MKPGSIVAAVPTGLVALALLFVACGRDETAPAPLNPAPPAPVAAEPLRKLHVRLPDNQVAVTFRWSAKEVQVLFEEGEKRRFLRSLLGQGRQRRYNERGVGPVALVRSNPAFNAFTVLSEDGEPRLRVRLGKKVAVVADATDRPLFDLLRPKDHVVRVVSPDKAELGRAVLAKSRVRVLDAQGTVTYKAGKGAPDSLLYGAFAVPDMDPVTRYILMAELLIRQR